jgi:hypothetical protein
MISLFNKFNSRSDQPIDSRFVQPSKLEALSNITISKRYIGLTIFLLDEKKEYIFKDGIQDSNLIEKLTDSTSSSSNLNRRIITEHAIANNNDYCIVIFNDDLTSQNINITLPEDPIANDTIIIHDIAYKCNNNITITILGNNKSILDNIPGDSDDLLIDISGAKLTLTYNDILESWDVDFNQINISHKDAAEGYLPPAIDLSNYITKQQVQTLLKKGLINRNTFSFSLTFTESSQINYIFLPYNVQSIYINNKYTTNTITKLKLISISNSVTINSIIVSDDKNNPDNITHLANSLVGFTIQDMGSAAIANSFSLTVTVDPSLNNLYVTSSLVFTNLSELKYTILPDNLLNIFIYNKYANHGVINNLALIMNLTNLQDNSIDVTVSQDATSPTDITALTPYNTNCLASFKVINASSSATIVAFGLYMELLEV